jgi:hypothetical protein
MLIYLDSNIVQYCADHEEFIFGDVSAIPTGDEKLMHQLVALRRLVELDQLASWIIAASPQLVAELFAGKPKTQQKRVYRVLLKAFDESQWGDEFPIDDEKVRSIEKKYAHLHLSKKDMRHLAEAIVLQASWFLTNDKGILKQCRKESFPVRISRVSDCLDEISVGLFLK